MHKPLTSSNFLQIRVNALKIALVDPVTVTMRSGHEPSDMLIFAPDWKEKVQWIHVYYFFKPLP